MNLIENNPYRIAGILSNATARELQKQKAKIKAYSKVGKEIKSDYDFQFLSTITRTEDSIDKAFSSIEQNSDRVYHSLFWFINSNSSDNTPIEYLKIGDKNKAIEIWEKVTTDKGITAKNFSSFNNLGTCRLLSEDSSQIQAGIENKIGLISSDYFKNYVLEVADDTYTIDQQKEIERFIDGLLIHLKEKYSSATIITLFDNCPSIAKKYVSSKFTDERTYQIENAIEKCKKQRKENKSNAFEFGKKLHENCQSELSFIESVLGKTSLKYKTIADSLANEILQCGIDYFNNKQENNSNDNYLESAKELTKLAASIAVGKLMQDRAKDSLASLSEMKDREISQAIEVLKNVKSAYESNKTRIEAEVRSMRLGYNQSINWTKVNKLIEQSIDWTKVAGLIKSVIPISNVEKIKNSNQQSKINEYKSLVDFVFGKLNYTQINDIKYICYWKDESAMWTATKNIASNKAKDACYIATMAYGDYDHPQVVELRKFRDDFLSKTIIGRSFIKFYYKYSPSWVEKLKNKQNINLIIREGLDRFIKIIKK